MRVLIIEDDEEIAAALQRGLEPHYAVDTVHLGARGAFQADVNQYDLIILDLGLPDINGVEACRKMRADQIQTPILILTGKDSIEDKVAALDAGADDYLTKPFSFTELSARIRALLRRNPESLTSNILAVDNLVLNIATRTVERAGAIISLRRKEFDLLEYLMRNQGRVLTRSMILEHVWDMEVDSFSNATDVHIKHLRDHVDKPYPKKLIKTIHGVGYKIEP